VSSVIQGRSFDIIEILGQLDHLPFSVRQSNSKLSRLPSLLLMTVLAAAIVLPQIVFAGYAFMSPVVRALLAARPAIALELALALTFWIGLVVWPLRNILMALISERIVDIRHGFVKVLDRTPFSASLWQAPLESFEGLAVHTRTSISGVRQEAVLVHPNRGRSIVLMASNRIDAQDFDKLCRSLSMAVVPASLLYDMRDKPRGRQNAVAA
jgi:hypothetical protein